MRIALIQVFEGLTMCMSHGTLSLIGGQWEGHAQPRKGVRASVQRVISLSTFFYKVLAEGR